MRSVSTLGSQRGGFNMGCLLAVILVIVVAGVGIFFLGKAGLNVVAEQVKMDIRDNPVIQEHIGEIQEIELNLKASGASAQKEQFVFDVKGTKGSGQLTVKVDAPEDPEKAQVKEGEPFMKVLSGSLRMADGTTHEILPAVVVEETAPDAPAPVPAPAGGN